MFIERTSPGVDPLPPCNDRRESWQSLFNVFHDGSRCGAVSFPAGRSQSPQSSPTARASGLLSTTKPATLPAEEFGPQHVVTPMTDAEGREYVCQETADGKYHNNELAFIRG